MSVSYWSPHGGKFKTIQRQYCDSRQFAVVYRRLIRDASEIDYIMRDVQPKHNLIDLDLRSVDSIKTSDSTSTSTFEDNDTEFFIDHKEYFTALPNDIKTMLRDHQVFFTFSTSSIFLIFFFKR